MLNRITDSMNVQSQALVLRAERQRILASTDPMDMRTRMATEAFVAGINVYDILRRKKLVLTKAAVEALEARFK